MKRLMRVLPLLLAVSLTACSNEIYYEDTLFLFDTTVSYKIRGYRGYSGLKTEGDTVNILKKIDALSDAYHKRDVVGVYDLNQTNEKIQINEDFYNLLYWVKEAEKVAPYFNPLVGSLSNKWKESLEEKSILSDEIIQNELEKISNSELIIEKSEEGMFAQRKGDALIDLGAIAKGYALDACQEYLNDYSSGDYLINAGNSSILLGLKITKNKKTAQQYSVAINELSNKTSFYTSRSIVSTSGISEQGVKIGDTTYSHIVNPLTGSAINDYDAVIVVMDNKYGNGAIGDALSTSLMMSTLDEIKEMEKSIGFETIVIKDNAVIYKSESIELS